MMVGRRRMPQSILNPLEAESVAEPQKWRLNVDWLPAKIRSGNGRTV